MRTLTPGILALVLAGGSGLWAQGVTSRLVGVVTDSSGALVPAATVALTNEATGVSYNAVSTSAGTYVFEAIPVGTYSVTAEAPGFKKFTSRENQVTIGQPTTVNVTLSPGPRAETVEVIGTAETVQLSTSGNFGTLIEQRILQDFPIVGTRGRNPLNLVLTQPGVVEGANTGGGTHVHGARDRSWNYTLDGIDVNESSAGGAEFAPLRTNPDSLAEFRVLTSNVTAEFGRNSGGQVTMVTRSGTNVLHGTLFYFYRTPRFNANEWQNNFNKLGKRQFVQHIPGFSLGGPLSKSKTFFFVNAQFLRTLETGTFTRLVYTAEARRGNWRYVRGGRNRPAGSPDGPSVDASGNVLPGISVGTYDVPGSDPQRLGFDPEIQRVIGLTPLPNRFDVGDGLNVAGYSYTAPQREKQHDIVVRLDHTIDPRHSVFTRVAFGRQDTDCDQVNGGEARFPGLPCLVNTGRDPVNVAAGWRWNPTGNVVNELVVGGNHFTFDFDIPTADPSKPTLSFTGIAIPEDFEVGNLRTINTYQLVESLTYIRGAHTFKMGANVRYQQHEDVRGSVSGANVHPLVNFSTSDNTVDPATFRIPGDINTTFDRPALQSHINFLLGRVGAISQGFVSLGDRYGPAGTTFQFDARYPELDFYVQDNWKLRRHLTVDLGLRWELKLSPRNSQSLIRRPSQRVAVGEPPSNSLRWDLGPLYDDDVNNVAPSVGVAWDPTGSGKSSIRANYRLAYDRINTFVLSSRIFQSIPGITTAVTNTEFGQAGGRLRNLPALAPTAKPTDFIQPPPVSANSIHVVDPEFRAPRTHGWAVSYQREIAGGTVFEATYIGRHAGDLFGAYNANQTRYRDNGFLEAFNIVKTGGESDLMNRLLGLDTRRRPGETGSQMVRRLFQSTLDLNAVASLAASLGSRIQGGRTLPELAGLGSDFFFPYPQYLGGLNVIDSNDYSRYHGLELKLERRFRNGFGFMLGYTLSRSKDTRSFDPTFTVVSTGSVQSASSTPFDINDRSLNYAPSDFDRRHVVQGNWTAELPFGRGKRFGGDASGALNQVIGGWELSGFLLYRSGRPFTVYSGANTFTNVVQTPANCAGCSRSDGEVFDDPTGFKFFFDANDRARFSNPAPGDMGNTGRNFFIGPPSFRVDLGILKRFRVKDHTLEYRAEAINLTNTPTFGFPTAVSTNTLFGRIGGSVVSSSRKIQMGLKYGF